jgi:hypothetical protein
VSEPSSTDLPDLPILTELGSTADERGRVKRVIDTTFECVDGQVVATGALHDYWEDGDDRTDLHWYRVTMRMEGVDLTIVDVEVTPLVLPFLDCLDATRPAASLVGLSLRRGFVSRATELLGSVEGCTHLLTLVTAIAGAQIPAGYLSGRPMLEGGIAFKPRGFERIVGACKGWSEGSTAVRITRAGEPHPEHWHADEVPPGP